jgi:hypothetical protein
MVSLSEVSLNEFRESLKPADVRNIQIIFFAIAMGVLSFGFIIFVIYLKQGVVEPNNEVLSVLNIMTWFNLIVTFSMIYIGKFVSERQYSKTNLEKAVNKKFPGQILRNVNFTPAQKCLMVIRTASILRLATLEGPAFFGLVTLILWVFNGQVHNAPIYLVNILSTVPLFAYVIFNFPNKEKLIEIFQNKIQGSI